MTDRAHSLIRARYQLTEILGEGAHARTWLALDTASSGDGAAMRVAIKELPVSRLREWKQLDRFEREAQMLTELEHPGIPRLYDHFLEHEEQGTTYYIVEEWIEGDTLKDKLDGGEHFNERRVRDIMRQLLNILRYLHGRNPRIVHRDIKPSNIVSRSGGDLVLIDFGAVREAAGSSELGSTVVGTFGYMPPEQLHGSVKPASDMYSLAATACHLLTGLAPKNMAIADRPFALAFREHAAVTPAFGAMLDAMLEPDVEKRLTDVPHALSILDDVEMTPPRDEPLADLSLMDGEVPAALQAPHYGPRLVSRTQALYAFGLPPLWRYLLPVIGAAMLVTGVPGALVLIAGLVSAFFNFREGYSNYELLAEGTLIPARIMSKEERTRGVEIEYVYAYYQGKYRATLTVNHARAEHVEVGGFIQVAIDPDQPDNNIPVLEPPPASGARFT